MPRRTTTRHAAGKGQNSQLFGKVYFPRLAVPVSILISNLIAFAIQFVLFVVMYGLHRASHVDATYGMRWDALLLPLVQAVDLRGDLDLELVLRLILRLVRRGLPTRAGDRRRSRAG